MKLLDKIRQGASEASVLELHQGIHLLNDEMWRKMIQAEYEVLKEKGMSPSDAKASLAEKHGRSEHAIHSYLIGRR